MLSDYINMAYVEALEYIPFDRKTKFTATGVYRFYDAERKIIYIGKSNDLFRRINDHLHGRTHTKHFIKKVKYVDFIKEPLYENLLESILIAYYKPKYNQEVKNGWKKRKRRRK